MSGLSGHYCVCPWRTPPGMDEATLARAIEPFFSTKGIGKGTGLGLSMAHGLAAQLGGGLTIVSEPGHGTAIELWLPVSLGPLGNGDEARAASTPVRSQGCALLVDDEELVRMSTADMLADLGYETISWFSQRNQARLAEQASLGPGGDPCHQAASKNFNKGIIEQQACV
ncbi:hypothetical protein ABVK25_011398 [Lepraria finkii]|uniref:Histidine kinase domain-containing protein n=1 Tax=Lepraria finkii TaxID=1340010 RepID=A0ABR4AP95_9LECA